MDIKSILTSPKGRVGRMTFWIWQLCIAAPFIAADLAGLELESRFSYFWIAYLVAAYPAIMVQIKRWHDRDKSGWWCLINLIPFGNLWVLVECGFLPGTSGLNRYGADPFNKKRQADA
ncbi:DUF805 domain-containing protein [Alcanivorax sp.]|jgi:uncharacterized membrane protein YhaH (DUF805 family)|uniref:DUF805 domain-containing protein n=1 Tax=unclassified Alcanivorax TaxID=2638842 RepID=UPI000CDEBD7B